jgi:hypothetical protein
VKRLCLSSRFGLGVCLKVYIIGLLIYYAVSNSYDIASNDLMDIMN